jgi:hypothetical protein
MMLTGGSCRTREGFMRKIRTLISVSILALAAGVTAATAAGPTVTETQVDRTRVIHASPGTCPFDFVVHTQGIVRESVYQNGRDVTILHDFTVTYTNPVNGKSVRTVLAGPFVVEPNPDGTITVTIDGNDGLFTIPGQGIVFGDVGRLVYIASPDDPFTPLQILQSTGRQDATPFPAVCSGLA